MRSELHPVADVTALLGIDSARSPLCPMLIESGPSAEEPHMVCTLPHAVEVTKTLRPVTSLSLFH
jgi:hypothetical protein